MSLKAIVDDVSGAPEAARGFYAKIEGDDAGDLAGKYRLNVEGAHGYSLDAVDGLKSALSTERGDRRQMEARLREFDGVDASAARRALDHAARLSDRAIRSEADRLAADRVQALDAEFAEKRRAHAQEFGECEAMLSKALGEATVDHATRAALTAVGGNHAILGRLVTDRLRMVERDGKFGVEVVDANGNPRIKDARGTPVTVDELVAELRADPVYAVAFSTTDARRPRSPAGAGNAFSRAEWQAKLSNADEAGRRKLLVDYMRGLITVTD